MDPSLPVTVPATATVTNTTNSSSTTTTTKKTPRTSNKQHNNDKIASSSTTTTTISVDPIGPRKKKKKDRTTLTATSSSKGNHPKKLRLHESNSSQKQQQQHIISDPSSSSNLQSSSSSPPESSLPSSHRHQKDTATADGHMMHEMLNTFSTNEYQRFQSYQRASLSSSVIENYIAACIEYRYHHHHHHHRPTTTATSTNSSSSSSSSSNKPTRLEDYVSTPGQASEIGMIVATAAKIYAQRLIMEAAYLQKRDRLIQQSRKTMNTTNHVGTDHATAMDISTDHNTESTTATTTTTANNPNDDSSIHNNVLLCTYVYRAVQDRQLRNVDPGFFISPSIGSNTQSVDYNVHSTTSHLLYDQRRLATMAAIENHQNENNNNSTAKQEEKTL